MKFNHYVFILSCICIAYLLLYSFFGHKINASAFHENVSFWLEQKEERSRKMTDIVQYIGQQSTHQHFIIVLSASRQPRMIEICEKFIISEIKIFFSSQTQINETKTDDDSARANLIIRLGLRDIVYMNRERTFHMKYVTMYSIYTFSYFVKY